MNKNCSILRRMGIQAAILFMMGVIGLASCTWDEIPPPVIEIPDDGVSFSEDIIPIFEMSCATTNCHDGSWRPNLQENQAYDALIDGDYINTGSPANSELYTKIDGGSMDQYATDQDRALILTWIEEGAEDN